MQEPDIVDAEFEEIDKPMVNVGTVGHIDYGKEESAAVDEPETPRTRSELLTLLKDAYENDHVTKSQYRKMRRDLGGSGSEFTKKKTISSKRKSKRIAAKKARRKQRK